MDAESGGMQNIWNKLRARRTLLENFGYLSGLQLFNMAFPLLTYPYLIRVLNPEAYGGWVLAQGIAAYYSVVVNFGFQVSATRDIATHRDDQDKLAEIISSILQAKLGLWLACFASFLALLFSIPMLAENKLLYLFAFGATLLPLGFPEWYFQGIEKMKYVTLISFAIRVLTAIGIFTLIRSADDYLLLPLMNSAGAALSACVALYIVTRQGIRLSWQPWASVKDALRRSAPLFYSSGFASIADKGGTLVVGSALGHVELAYYNLAERLINFAASLYFNMGRTLYPNLAKSRDQAFSRKATKWVLGAGLFGTTAAFLLAPTLVSILGGSQMEPAVQILRILSPYLVLGAMGPLLVNILMIEDHHTSIFPNTVIAGVCYLGALALLVMTGNLTIITVALAFVFSVVVRFSHRFYMIKRHGLSAWLY